MAEHTQRRLHHRWLLSALLFGFLVRQSAHTQPFFAPDTALVVLSGIPGDLENETWYRDQLRACLDLAQGNSNITRVILLCDNPGSPGLPASARTTAIKGDRAHFLELTATLARQTNSISFIVWGHGGRQGATNVFHVRGPRITADDFSKVASELHASMSSWILYFRGSGVFAAKLTGPNRRIISSDADAGFNSDPIGMMLFLKALRDQADASFETLAVDLGKMTVAWYEERHLARVEEPALWLPERAPQL